MSPREFPLKTVLGIALLVVVSICVHLWALSRGWESSIRRDLEVPRTESVQILETETVATTGRSGTREEAFVVISDGEDYRLVFVSREPSSPNPNFSCWEVGWVSVMYLDGHDEWEFFDRTFDHFLTKQEIADFKEWVHGW